MKEKLNQLVKETKTLKQVEKVLKQNKIAYEETKVYLARVRKFYEMYKS